MPFEHIRIDRDFIKGTNFKLRLSGKDCITKHAVAVAFNEIQVSKIRQRIA